MHDSYGEEEEEEFACVYCGHYFEATPFSEEGLENTCRACLDES